MTIRTRLRAMGATSLVIVMAVGAAPAAAQQVQTIADDSWCLESRGSGDGERFCEVREASMAPTAIRVDAGRNGGISVEGWDRDEILVRMRVMTQARSDERARELASAVRLSMSGGEITASGPSTGREESWWVGFRVSVPHRNDLDLEANNGGISIADVSGRIRFETQNGGVSLKALGGDVVGETRNGGLTVSLRGSTWDGAGLDASTTNGGLVMNVPDGYNAQLETGTVNGSLDLDFPVMVQRMSNKRLDVALGSGGPKVRAVTTNGGVKIRRSNN